MTITLFAEGLYRALARTTNVSDTQRNLLLKFELIYCTSFNNRTVRVNIRLRFIKFLFSFYS